MCAQRAKNRRTAMSSTSLPELPDYVVRVRCLIPPAPTRSTSQLVKPSDSPCIMTTSTTNTYALSSAKPTSPQATCNICKRLLYSFEEILICRVCDGSSHWRCVKPETVTDYGDNAQFICDKCADSIALTIPTGRVKIKSTNISDADYRESQQTTGVVGASRYFEERQPPSPQKPPKATDADGQPAAPTNGHFTDDSKSVQRTQQQQQRRSFHTDDENTPVGMFQANYQYTPLKDYAATKNGRSANDLSTDAYQASPPSSSSRPYSSQYASGLRYSSHGYDSTQSHLTDSPSRHSTRFTSPTVDNLSMHNRQQHFSTTTNFNVTERSTHYQQQGTSTSYLSGRRENEPTSYKPTPPTDHQSAVGSDSGIVVTSSNQQLATTEDSQVMEQKLTTLVQNIGRQLETDAQKLSEKLELKLQNLEKMIHQQTFIIRQQDEVIERLKSKIQTIETERDHFRDRLSVHEQTGQDDKKYQPAETDESIDRKTSEIDDQQQTSNDISGPRKYSNTSSVTTDSGRRSNKGPAPRADQHTQSFTNETDPTLGKLIKVVPTNQPRPVYDPFNATAAERLAAAVPLTERPGASSRLDDIIHQPDYTPAAGFSPYYNVTGLDRTDFRQPGLSVSTDPILTGAHNHDDDDETPPRPPPVIRPNRSASSSTASSKASQRVDSADLSPGTNVGLSARNSNLHRSLETITRKPPQNEQASKLTNKTASLELGARPARLNDSSSIYVTPIEAAHPASQFENTMKGWLRKQNRESLFKRIERYYCVVTQNNLRMHRNENDRIAHKTVDLTRAKVVQYQDPKHGPSLELTWSAGRKTPKHYHLYTEKDQDAAEWVTAIQAAINYVGNRPPSKVKAAW